MTVNDIQNAVRSHITSNQAGLLPVKWDDERIDHDDKPYLEVIISPDETDPAMIDGDLLIGVLLGNVYFRKGTGANYPTIEAQKFIDLFPRGTQNIGGLDIDITQTGTPLNPARDQQRPEWKYVSGLVRYDAASCL